MSERRAAMMRRTRTWGTMSRVDAPSPSRFRTASAPGAALAARAAPAACAEEAAAIVAAVEQFIRATTPSESGLVHTASNQWRQAALLEGLARAGEHDLPDPWINT